MFSAQLSLQRVHYIGQLSEVLLREENIKEMFFTIVCFLPKLVAAGVLEVKGSAE
jgi:hypothetical protein